jgi:hypothetical protein
MRPIFFVFLLCIGLTFAAPSNLINHSPRPVTIDLRNVDPSSAKDIDDQNANLSAAKSHELEDLGPHFSGGRAASDLLTNVDRVTSQTNFINQEVGAVPKSIGNSKRSALTSGSVNQTNTTIINETTMTMINGTMAWF